MREATYLASTQKLNSYKIKEKEALLALISEIQLTHIAHNFRFCKLMAYSILMWLLICDRRDPENQTQTEEVQNDDFVKTIH